MTRTSTVSVADLTEPTLAPTFALTDAGNAEYFAYHFQDRVRFDHRRGRYLMWRDHRWAPDQRGDVRKLILDAVRLRGREAFDHEDREEGTKARKWALASESRQRLEAIYVLAQSLPGIADAGHTWDADPALLGVRNGVIDLRTGELRDGERDDKITLQASVLYDPAATSDLWQRALSEIIVDLNHIDYVQVAFGYSLTGVTREDTWFLCDGLGRNGKGTILRPIFTALGDYALELPAAVFSQRDREPYELANLPGRRFVLSSESGSLRLNEDRMKQLTGNDIVSAHNKYEKPFQFLPVSKFWFACNQRPRVSDDSPGFWARVSRIPFTQSFVGREDRHLRPALCEDEHHQRAVLASIVAGAVKYYQSGLPSAPAAFTAATEAYREESDPLADFLADAIERDDHASLPASELYRHYADWAQRQGFSDRERLTVTAFGRRMGTLFQSDKGRAGKRYLGVARRIA